LCLPVGRHQQFTISRNTLTTAQMISSDRVHQDYCCFCRDYYRRTSCGQPDTKANANLTSFPLFNSNKSFLYEHNFSFQMKAHKGAVILRFFTA
jgi:hypothetical protein